MAATLQLPYNVQRSASPGAESGHTVTPSSSSSLMKKGAHLSRIIVAQTSSRDGRDSISPKWSGYVSAGSLPSSRSPSPRRPLVRQSSSTGSRGASFEEEMVIPGGSSSNTLGVPSPPRSVRVSPLPSPTAGTTVDCRSPRPDRQMSLERSESMNTENEEVGSRTDELCQAMGSVFIGKRKEVTQPQERQQQELPAKRPKTVAEYAKSVQMAPLLLSPNPDAEALLTCLGFGGSPVPYSAPPFQQRPFLSDTRATHSLEAFAAQGLPASVMGKRFSAPPTLAAAANQVRQRHTSPLDGGCKSSYPAADNVMRTTTTPSPSVAADHRSLCRTDKDAVAAARRSPSPARNMTASPSLSSPQSGFLSTNTTPASTVPSPSKYVANRIRFQRRRSLQAQRMQLSIVEGSQENLSLLPSAAAARSVSPFRRQASADSSTNPSLLDMLDGSSTFVFSGAKSPSRDASPHRMRKSHSFDVSGMGATDAEALRQFQVKHGLDKNGSTSSSSLPSMLDDDNDDMPMANHAVRSGTQKTTAASASRTKFALSSVPSVVLNDEHEVDMDVEAETGTDTGTEAEDCHGGVAAVAMGNSPSASTAPFQQASSQTASVGGGGDGCGGSDCTMASAATWAGLSRQDPYSYDMSRMLAGYSWERMAEWNRYAAESGMQIPVSRTSHAQPSVSATARSVTGSGNGRSMAMRTQSLAETSVMPADHQSATRRMSIPVTISHNQSDNRHHPTLKLSANQRRSVFAKSNTKTDRSSDAGTFDSNW